MSAASTASGAPIGPKRGLRRRRPQVRLAVALPFVTGLLALGVGLYAFQVGRAELIALVRRAKPRGPDPRLWLRGGGSSR